MSDAANESHRIPPMQVAVTIVNRGQSSKVIAAARAGGAEGGTVLLGRGTGIHERKKLLGISIEPEKDIVLTLAPEKIMSRVVDHIVEACDLDKPATGICFVLPTLDVRGIHHHFDLNGD